MNPRTTNNLVYDLAKVTPIKTRWLKLTAKIGNNRYESRTATTSLLEREYTVIRCPRRKYPYPPKVVNTCIKTAEENPTQTMTFNNSNTDEELIKHLLEDTQENEEEDEKNQTPEV